MKLPVCRGHFWGRTRVHTWKEPTECAGSLQYSPATCCLQCQKSSAKQLFASTSNNNHLFMKTISRLCQSPTSDQELLLGEADMHGMLRSHFESLQGILGVSGLSIRLKLYKGNVTASRHQTHLLEPREPVSGGGAAQIQGKGRKGLSTNGMSVWLYTIEMLVTRHAHIARFAHRSPTQMWREGVT